MGRIFFSLMLLRSVSFGFSFPVSISPEHGRGDAVALTSDVSSGHSLIFHFSGHGSQRRCFKGDEPDGFDETLCSVDCKKDGIIVDNDINEILVRPLPIGAQLHAIV
ncbi:hypothetical protein J5N97_018795 [Dioscorea zingiberensis]|uniref:Uncharacterized protein n=1 Tax=Dioscorea zingiberensis TaxID=325984 RepID=A0A9D5CCK2_9LILI|nr:hypothetical protein J5N97_018795 [Dioscorea zingiberensis]